MVSKLMNRLFKLVALLLAVVLFGTPLLALARCSAKLSAAGHCGGEDCPMMMHARQATTTQLSGIPSGNGSCCKVSTLPENAIKPAVTQAKAALQLSATVQTPSAIVPLVLSLAEGAPVPLLEPSSSPQAVLCTFLL